LIGKLSEGRRVTSEKRGEKPLEINWHQTTARLPLVSGGPEGKSELRLSLEKKTTIEGPYLIVHGLSKKNCTQKGNYDVGGVPVKDVKS